MMDNLTHTSPEEMAAGISSGFKDAPLLLPALSASSFYGTTATSSLPLNFQYLIEPLSTIYP